MQSAPLKSVMVGCGEMSGVWLQAATENPDLQVVALVDLNLDAARARARDYHLESALVTDRLEDAIGRTGAAAVLDCTAPRAHCPVTLAALRHGCHVLGEKPMSDSMDNARSMVAAAQEAGRLYAVIQNQRYYGNIRRLKAFLDTGALGRLTALHCDFIIGAHFGGFRDAMDHVLLLDMAIHTFDEARYLLGGAQAKSVLCHEWNPPGSWYAHGAAAMAAFEMDDGAAFTYRGSWCAEGPNTSWQGAWRIQGERGGVLWDGDDGFKAELVPPQPGAGLIWKRESVEVPPLDVPAKSHGHKSILAEFAVAARDGGAPPETICTDNIKSLAMVFAAIASAGSGARVVLS